MKDNDNQAHKTEKKHLMGRKQRVKMYLLPSTRLPGRGLPLNMAAVHPRMILTDTRERGEERHCYRSPQGKVGNGGKAAPIIKVKPPPSHHIHPHSLRWMRTLIGSLLQTERNNRVSHLCPWPCHSAAPPPPCTPSVPPRGCCPPCGRGRGEAR